MVFGRTMEWSEFDLEPQFVLAPRGMAFAAATMPDGKAGMAWPVKYAFAGVSLLGQPVFADTVNEKGSRCPCSTCRALPSISATIRPAP